MLTTSGRAVTYAEFRSIGTDAQNITRLQRGLNEKVQVCISGCERILKELTPSDKERAASTMVNVGSVILNVLRRVFGDEYARSMLSTMGDIKSERREERLQSESVGSDYDLIINMRRFELARDTPSGNPVLTLAGEAALSAWESITEGRGSMRAAWDEIARRCERPDILRTAGIAVPDEVPALGPDPVRHPSPV